MLIQRTKQNHGIKTKRPKRKVVEEVVVAKLRRK